MIIDNKLSEIQENEKRLEELRKKILPQKSKKQMRQSQENDRKYHK